MTTFEVKDKFAPTQKNETRLKLPNIQEGSAMEQFRGMYVLLYT